MVLGEETNKETETKKTQNKTLSQERRNSVSEITEFFQAQVQTQFVQQSPMSTPNPVRKTSGRLKEKEKNKEREKELKQARENIKAFIAKMPENQSTETGICTNEESNHDKQTTNMLNNEQDKEESPIEQPLNCNTTSSSTQTEEDEILKAIRELASKYQTIDETINDPRNGLTKQLAKTQETVKELYSDINGAVSGLKIQVQKLTTTAQENTKKIESMEDTQKRMAALLDENQRLAQEMKLMQGIIDKIATQTDISSAQIINLTKRGMEQNLVLHGVDDSFETINENVENEENSRSSNTQRCQRSALKFLKEELDLDLSVKEIWKAHRVGQFKQDKLRPLVIKVSYEAKELIMDNIAKLKGRSNAITKQKYYIAEQIPEAAVELKKQTNERVKSLKGINDKKPKELRSKIQVINENILIDNEPYVPEIVTPRPSQLFLRKEEQARIDQMQQGIIESTPSYERGSEFIGLAVKVHSIAEIKDSYIAVAQRYPTADHIILGYALKEDGKLKSGFCDNREFGAGSKVKNKIFEYKARNTAVFVVRKYGGVHLGYSRFSHIEKVAVEAIQGLN